MHWSKYSLYICISIFVCACVCVCVCVCVCACAHNVYIWYMCTHIYIHQNAHSILRRVETTRNSISVRIIGPVTPGEHALGGHRGGPAVDLQHTPPDAHGKTRGSDVGGQNNGNSTSSSSSSSSNHMSSREMRKKTLLSLVKPLFAFVPTPLQVR